MYRNKYRLIRSLTFEGQYGRWMLIAPNGDYTMHEYWADAVRRLWGYRAVDS